MESGYRQGYTQGIADGLSKVNVQYTYHKHTGNSSTYGGCYTKTIYHSHSSTCYTQCTGSVGMVSESGGWYYYRCDKCGNNTSGTTEFNYKFACTNKILSCTKTTSTVERYNLGCGKTTDTIESVTIKY